MIGSGGLDYFHFEEKSGLVIIVSFLVGPPFDLVIEIVYRNESCSSCSDFG